MMTMTMTTNTAIRVLRQNVFTSKHDVMCWDDYQGGKSSLLPDKASVLSGTGEHYAERRLEW